jgi:hypothetical protein
VVKVSLGKVHVLLSHGDALNRLAKVGISLLASAKALLGQGVDGSTDLRCLTSGFVGYTLRESYRCRAGDPA